MGGWNQAFSREPLQPTEWAGYRAHTKAHSTGTLSVLVDGYEQGLESPRWWLICDPHAECVGFDRQKDARSFMAHPEAWCPTCQDGKGLHR